MAQAFNLTAQINLQAPANLKTIVAQIRREFATVSADVKINISGQSAKSIDNIKTKLDAMNASLIQARNNTTALDSALRNLSSSLSSVQSTTSKTDNAFSKTSTSVGQTAKNIKVATTEMEEFGKQSALAIRRFAAFSVVTSGVFALINAVNSGFQAFVEFDKELVKLQQVTGRGEIGLKSLEKEISNLSTTLGVSSKSLMSVASTLAQAGLSADETRVALAALAKTELAPSFDNLTDTTEGAIAAIRQFGLEAGDLEKALGSINAVAAAFAVESKDIIAAIQRTGGVFAASSRGVSEGTDALNEFIAVFTSIRQTTRESAETIATGLRTIFTRIQRAKTIDQLKEYGVTLTDLEGKFVGPYEAVKRLSAALSQLDPRDLRFSSIVEELGGFRQIGKVIPLIQQFKTAQDALAVAQKGQGSLYDAQVTAQKSLANQLAKVREQF
jgi:TP901 family phage tail tape measure protein